jgi:DNA modification methylase
MDDDVAAVLAGERHWHVACGDAPDFLRGLPGGCVQTCVTSPPYYGLRSYLPDGHPDKSLEIGSEETPAGYVARMVAVFEEVRRVLRPDGTCWANFGDSYAANMRSGGPHGATSQRKGRANVGEQRSAGIPAGYKPKDLLGIPWMVAFALRDAGWWLRSDIPWVKRGAMPESVTDRPAKALEYVFLLAKSERYYFDMEAVRRPNLPQSVERVKYPGRGHPRGWHTDAVPISGGDQEELAPLNPAGRNWRNADPWFASVAEPWGVVGVGDEWVGLDVSPGNFPGAHFAVMPEALAEPCVLAGTSEKGACARCGAPWRRVVARERAPTRPGTEGKIAELKMGQIAHAGRETPPGNWRNSTLGSVVGNRDPQRHCTTTTTTGWGPSCGCGTDQTRPCLVLDPFAGSATTLVVAVRHGRRALGCDLSPAYCEMARKRLANTTPSLWLAAGG